MLDRTALDIVAGGKCPNLLIPREHRGNPPIAGGDIHTRSVYL